MSFIFRKSREERFLWSEALMHLRLSLPPGESERGTRRVQSKAKGGGQGRRRRSKKKNEFFPFPPRRTNSADDGRPGLARPSPSSSLSRTKEASKKKNKSHRLSLPDLSLSPQRDNPTCHQLRQNQPATGRRDAAHPVFAEEGRGPERGRESESLCSSLPSSKEEEKNTARAMMMRVARSQRRKKEPSRVLYAVASC